MLLTVAFDLFHTEEETFMEGMAIVNITRLNMSGLTQQQNGRRMIYLFQWWSHIPIVGGPPGVGFVVMVAGLGS